ncbi:Gfo/Idh/MocA family oxidoreductase [Methanospirillum stamsii]|uniref:Gfo/Idh/MocA family oxidoreductase n=1 Tax=Methanospirillum stamsii TaxID=1277351 RepID=A0A2V2MQ12_9EURY|nr:Gfo/Idh/MocA family oxidoreductase [Methanospirillum stamsii]PWR69499.1 gfo/Idh/MocA family oxidoreductase [Methanospirillum stamsii]
MDVGVIGTGMMGQNHVRVYSELKEVDSVVIYDVNRSQAEKIATQNNAEVADSYEDLFHRVEAVSLCVPTPFHYNVALQVINAGMNILIEKPICLSSSESKELEKQTPDDIVVGVGHIERFNPIVSEISQIISDPLYIEFKRHNPTSSRITGSSVVEDLMIHDIDIMLHALGCSDLSVQAKGNDDVAAALCTSGNSVVYLSASRKSSKKIRMVHIEQEDMTIQGDFMAQEIYVHRKPGQYKVERDRYVQENIVEKVQVAKLEPLRAELSTFLMSVKTSTPFPITSRQAIENLEFCEMIKEMF